MPCCGYALSRRDWMWSTALGSFGAMLAGCARTSADNPTQPDASTRADATASDSSLAAANALLRDNVAIDVHTHAGANGITSRTARPTDDLARQMRAGRIAVLCLADVPDAPILGRNAQNVLSVVRTPEPGFLYAYHLDRLAWVDELVANHGIRRALTVADVRAGTPRASRPSSSTSRASTFSSGSRSVSRSRTVEASARCRSCTTRRTTSTTSRPTPWFTTASRHSART